MKNLLAVGLVLAVLQGCGGSGLYPDTDIVEPRDFQIKVGTGMQMSGGLLLSGNLEYTGSGDLVQVFRDYVAAMRSHGWNSAGDEINAQKALATLRKDNRTCTVDFTSTAGQIRALIKVSQTK